jgi:peptidoglycan/LPS O-acetylase OafA/YrhL
MLFLISQETVRMAPARAFSNRSCSPGLSSVHRVSSTTPAVSGSDRRHDLDALRAFAMLLGLVLHGAMAFMPFPWIVQDTQKTPAVGLLVAVIHGFRMPLFFVMSGFFTAMLWQKRGAASMLWQRWVRVFVPCMLGLVTLLPATEWVAVWSREAVARQNRVAGAGPADAAWITAVSEAVTQGDAMGLASLLGKEEEAEGPRPPLVDPASQSPLLTIAAVLGHVDVARELIDHGADVDARDDGGRTAMHAAAFLGQAEVVELLLARGAEPLPKGPMGSTPLGSTNVDPATTMMLAGVLGLPTPDMAKVDAGRRRVRELLAAATGAEVGSEGGAEAPGSAAAAAEPAAVEPALAGLAGIRRAYTAWLTSEQFVVPLPPWGEPQNLFVARVFDHLWFLWYLCWLMVGFALLAGAAGAVRLPLPPRWLVVSPAALVWLVPLTLGPQLFMGLFTPNFGPDTSLALIPQPHILAYYSVFFGYGAVLFLVGDPEQRVGRRWWWSLLLSVVVCFPAGLVTMGNPVATALPQVLFAWLMSFGLIGLFRAALPAENQAIRYLSDSAYWLYLAHIPVLVAIQTWARPWPWPPLLKLLFEVTVATVLLLISYQLFVRPTPLGWLLNGRRRPAVAPAVDTGPAVA